MTPVSLILAIVAIVVFLAGSRSGRPWADINLGLALLTAAWIIQLMWQTTNQINVG